VHEAGVLLTAWGGCDGVRSGRLGGMAGDCSHLTILEAMESDFTLSPEPGPSSLVYVASEEEEEVVSDCAV
jgi:hypothetical protein